MSVQHRVISAYQFAEALVAAGVIESGDLVHRVVIDAVASGSRPSSDRREVVSHAHPGLSSRA